VGTRPREFSRASFLRPHLCGGGHSRRLDSELTRASEPAGDHLSLYHSTIEPGTPLSFHTAQRAWRFSPCRTHDPSPGRATSLTQAAAHVSRLPGLRDLQPCATGREYRGHNLVYGRYGRRIPLSAPGAHVPADPDGRQARHPPAACARALLAAVERAADGTEELSEVNPA